MRREAESNIAYLLLKHVYMMSQYFNLFKLGRC